MTHYICPICDKELKGGHFCSTCKKWISEPVVYHGESMPNEHSDSCYVPSAKAQREPVANVSRDYTRQAPRKTSAPSHRPTPTYNQRSSRRTQPSSTGKGVGFFIFVIWMIIVIFMGILGN